MQCVFGIIGTGRMARSQHIPNMLHAPHIRLKTACDLNEDSVHDVCEKYGIGKAETDHRRLLADPEIQAVVIATREDVQAPLTVEALKAGKHVYVEKPLAKKHEEVEAVLEAQKMAGKNVAVGFNRRFAPAYRKAMEIISEHGGARNIHYRISDEYWRWHHAKHGYGYRIIYETCHIFDIFRWFFNSDPESIHVLESRGDDEVIALKFKNGAVASIMSSAYVCRDVPKERVEIVTERGFVTVEEFVELRSFGHEDFERVYRFEGHPAKEGIPKHLFLTSGAAAVHDLRHVGWKVGLKFFEMEENEDIPENPVLRELFINRLLGIGYMVNKGWVEAIDHFAECIIEDKKPENAGAEDGLWSVRMSEAGIKSRESGEIVRFE